MRHISEYVKEILAECTDATVIIVKDGRVEDVLNAKTPVFVVDIDTDTIAEDDEVIITKYGKDSIKTTEEDPG